MENKENAFSETSKAIKTLTKELESLNNEDLHGFLKFFYKISHIHVNLQEISFWIISRKSCDGAKFMI